MRLLSHLHRHAWARLLRLALMCTLASGPLAHNLAMAAAVEQQAQAMPCHHAEPSDSSDTPSLAGCHCGNAVQCTCAMAPTLPVMPLLSDRIAVEDDYRVTRYSLTTHLPPAPEPPPPRR